MEIFLTWKLCEPVTKSPNINETVFRVVSTTAFIHTYQRGKWIGQMGICLRSIFFDE